MEHGATGIFFWKFVNVIILFALLYWLLKKPVSKFIHEGMNKITKQFEDAKKEKEEALKILKEADRKLQEAKEEASRIVSYSKELAQKEKEEIIKDAEETAKRIIKMADEEIGREVLKAKEELKAFAVEKAIELAEENLRSSVNPETDKKLIKASLQRI
jgi:F-type H+-transporting ATPase subunit b